MWCEALASYCATLSSRIMRCGVKNLSDGENEAESKARAN